MGLFRNSKELQFRTCQLGKTIGKPNKGEELYGEKGGTGEAVLNEVHWSIEEKLELR